MSEMVEKVARAAYEADPYYQPGECVEGFIVSPGGFLTWEQAKKYDAEFGDGSGFVPCTKSAYACARAAFEALRKPTRAMLIAGSNKDMGLCESDVELGWQAMIDEALKG